MSTHAGMSGRIENVFDDTPVWEARERAVLNKQLTQEGRQ